MATKIPGLPTSAYPIVDVTTGKINPVWYQFFNSLLQVISGDVTVGNISASSITSTGPISGTDGTFSGTMEFGKYSSGTFPQTGYIVILDSNGTSRRLMVG